DIIIGTQYYLEQFYRPEEDRFGLVALVCADQILHTEKGLDRAVRTFNEYAGVALRSNAKFIVQTWDKEQFLRMIREPEKLVAQECKARKSFKQAPFVQEITLKEIPALLVEELEMRYPNITFHPIGVNEVKIVTDNERLLDELRALDDNIVISNKTAL
ncbi:MAG: hypothetical protein O2877_03010, partial [bacterium]|nr:hypothetical protein [bacterium]